MNPAVVAGEERDEQPQERAPMT
ncbi:MAG: hypothetical protein RLZZ468_118, partial [Cyanobacteriota bacterium]